VVHFLTNFCMAAAPVLHAAATAAPAVLKASCPVCAGQLSQQHLRRLVPEAVEQLLELQTDMWLQQHGIIRYVMLLGPGAGPGSACYRTVAHLLCAATCIVATPRARNVACTAVSVYASAFPCADLAARMPHIFCHQYHLMGCAPTRAGAPTPPARP
jgi:hypothetical protein